MELKKLDWDSGFFGLRIGRAEFFSKEEGENLVNQKAKVKEEFDLVYVFTNHGLGFSDVNAKLVDEKVVYALSDTSCSEPSSDVILWEENRGVTEDLLHLALVSGKYSRFRLDDGLPQGSYERLYSRWIERSVNQSIASEVFCYMVEGVPRGLVTLNDNNGVGTIGLVAIHENFQHQGIGSAMMRHVIYFSKENQIAKLSVATQLNNILACRLYEKCGFVVESVTDVWHWWL